MQVWFWGWVVTAVAAGLLAALARDRTAAPFAVGAASAAAIEAVWGQPAWEWIAFLAVSVVLFIALNRRWYRPKHGHDPHGRHSRSHAARD
jgi:membrane protein implicated in regulation of membrane protease activity